MDTINGVMWVALGSVLGGTADSGCPDLLRGVSARHFPGERWSSMSAARFCIGVLAASAAEPRDFRGRKPWQFAVDRHPGMLHHGVILQPSNLVARPRRRHDARGLEYRAFALSLSCCRRSRLCGRPPRVRVKGGSAMQDNVSPDSVGRQAGREPSASASTPFRLVAEILGHGAVPIFRSRSVASSAPWRVFWFPFCP